MNDPISNYVTELAATLKGQRDATDLVAEMEDHLREAAESLILSGRPVILAQEAAIMRLGEPQLVARALLA
ncbi:MAG: permease prefix domain 1-containing protein, partial [Micropruina sp.]